MTTPTITVVPCLRYRDCNRAIEFLKAAFGFMEHAVYRGEDGVVHHAELLLGNGMVMLGSTGLRPETDSWYAQPDETGNRLTSSQYLILNDVAAAYATAQTAGATVLMPLETKDYGGSGFTVRDPEDQIWSVGDYDPMTAPSA
ncbi:MAG: VOC family protein [Terriglobus sp.]